MEELRGNGIGALNLNSNEFLSDQFVTLFTSYRVDLERYIHLNKKYIQFRSNLMENFD